MALCHDQSLTYLNRLGYNVVRLPRHGIEPLDVLGKDGKSIERLGTLDQMWASAKSAPTVNAPQAASGVEGQSSGDLKLSIGLKILASALGAMGAAVPQVGFAYQKASSVRFTFSNVKAVAVDPFKVGEFLEQGDLHTSNPFVSHYFDSDDVEAFVITEVLQSNQVTVIGTTGNGGEVSVDADAIAQAVGAAVKVTATNASKTQLTYQGQDPITFGFKLFGIAYENGRWQVKGVPPSADHAYVVSPGGGAASGAEPVLLQPAGTVLVR